jgi:hypothetical protein
MISSLKDSTLEALNGICFHDIDVLNMNFDFKKGSLTLEFMEFDDDASIILSKILSCILSKILKKRL